MTASHEWIIVGGGIAGIALAEILTREGHSVLLLERDQRLAAQATGDLHEWIHTGCLYTLLPDNLVTMKYLLGAIDDLLEYYQSFPRMNAVPTEQGLAIEHDGWFEPNAIHFRYRNHRHNLLWMLAVARSRFLIDRIAKHDWLRRRAGIFDEFNDGRWSEIRANLLDLARSRAPFHEVRSTDFTTDSRLLLRDLLSAALANGLDVRLGEQVTQIRDAFGEKLVLTDRGSYRGQQVVLCAGRAIADFVDVKVTTSYAPMAVVSGLSSDAHSFVELDSKVTNCINVLTKGEGIGLVGGISLKHECDCRDYLDGVIERHKTYEPAATMLGYYIGIKSEITFWREDRNYLFHIVACGQNLWATVPGKFTLGFSLAPEFYRRMYHRNPRKYFSPPGDAKRAAELIAPARWHTLVGDVASPSARGAAGL